MLYTTFIMLCEEAGNHGDCQEFIMTLGWQPWMDKFEDNVNEITRQLSSIFELAGLDIPGLRDRLGISRRRMSTLYRIPTRTIENWELESSVSRKPAPYIVDFIRYCVFVREMEGDDGHIGDLETQD